MIFQDEVIETSKDFWSKDMPQRANIFSKFQETQRNCLNSECNRYFAQKIDRIVKILIYDKDVIHHK